MFVWEGLAFVTFFWDFVFVWDVWDFVCVGPSFGTSGVVFGD